MFNEHLQGVDVTSMLDASLQQKINPEIGSTKKYPSPETLVLINHVHFLNFQKTLKTNSLYFRNFSTYKRKDEVNYNEYDKIYTKYLPESEQNKCIQRNRDLSKSVYVLPMYNRRDLSNLHLEQYAIPPNGEDYDKNLVINKTHLAVFYNWERLFSHLKKNAWSKSHMDSFKETPVVSLTPNDRIFCGGVQYLEDLSPQDVLFDPANAIVPFFLKENVHSAENEYRLCVFIHPKFDFNGKMEQMKSQGIYVQVGNVLEVIDKIIFSSEDKLIIEEIQEQFQKIPCVKSNLSDFNFNWLASNTGDIELTICKKTPYTNEPNMDHDFSQIKHHFECFNPIESNVLSLYSSKYDSMKQRSILMSGNREYNYRCYNATLKLEMLLFGKVTITDSQYYDGLLFKEMIAHREFEDFITCSHKHDTFKIKIRCDNKKFIRKVFGKQFYPSSVKSFAIGKMIDKITQELEGQNESFVSEKCDSIDNFIRYLQSQFPVPCKRFEEELDYFGRCFVLFQSVYSCMFEIWSDFDFDAEFINLGEKSNSFNSLHKILNDIISSVKMSDEDSLPFENSIQSLGARLKNFEEEFKKVKSFRSAIYSFQSEILQRCNKMRANNALSQEQWNHVVNKCKNLIDEFNYIYNRVISKQHRCIFVDMISKNALTPPATTVTISFDYRLSEFLFLSSWRDFDLLLSNPEIQTIRRQITSILEKLTSDIPVLHHDDEINLNNLFSHLDMVLKKYYSPILKQLDEKKSDFTFNPDAASTNYFGTEKLILGNGTCGRFIGNGCVLDDSYTDKLSLYLPNENNGTTVFDLCFGEHLDDTSCNTISLTNT